MPCIYGFTSHTFTVYYQSMRARRGLLIDVIWRPWRNSTNVASERYFVSDGKIAAPMPVSSWRPTQLVLSNVNAKPTLLGWPQIWDKLSTSQGGETAQEKIEADISTCSRLPSIWHLLPTLQQDPHIKNWTLESPQDTWSTTERHHPRYNGLMMIWNQQDTYLLHYLEVNFTQFHWETFIVSFMQKSNDGFFDTHLHTDR